MHHAGGDLTDAAPRAAARLVGELHARGPRVHCITNTVAQAYTANMLLAAGGVPSMTLSAEEIGGFVARADALLVNLGTFDAERRAATGVAIAAAHEHRRPWVLDPVFVDRSASRAAFARDLVRRGARVVRLNHAELTALADGATREDAMAYARATGVVVAVSGTADLITDGMRTIAIGNGHPLMARVTAMGCAGSALVAACLALEPDALMASAAALIALGVAGEIAAEKSAGPGSFAFHIIDALAALDAPTLMARAKVSA
ncbi:MAG TPA: hydroxyethylthiazole kinase [Pseudolabrys sp.]|uniref:hydroxyethylthiazole kinase n=1 Tax=Pseudolabrys sp. TaxID=1960880 RepID=UPI002DDCBBF6|nr:hydroxyethylthiazole kinase [Pseudolabrys sp.]HEV2629177.1 hydroxyethylthiazole kinase [Pseudolabrys sp.]